MDISLAPVAVTVARSLWTRVWVHVISGNYVNAYIWRRAAHFVPLTSWNRYRSLAAAVVEQINVRITEVTIREAVDDIVETRFAQPDPGGRIKHAVCHIRCGVVGQHNAKGQPKCYKNQKAVKICTCQWQVPSVILAWLEVGRAHESLHVNDDAHVRIERQDDGQQNEQRHYDRLVWCNVGRLTGAIIETNFEHELKARRDASHKPNQQENSGGVSFVEIWSDVLGRAQPKIVLGSR